MCFIFSLMPATVFLALGYLVLYGATHSEGGFQTFGKILSVWIFILAAFPPLIGAYVTIADVCPIEAIVQQISTHE